MGLYVPRKQRKRWKEEERANQEGQFHAKKTLVQCGRAAGNSKDTYLSALYHRIAARRGAKRAAVAVGHSILVTCYHMIQNRTHYRDLGADFFQNRNKEALVKQHIKRLQALGFKVTLEHTA